MTDDIVKPVHNLPTPFKYNLPVRSHPSPPSVTRPHPISPYNPLYPLRRSPAPTGGAITRSYSISHNLNTPSQHGERKNIVKGPEYQRSISSFLHGGTEKIEMTLFHFCKS